MEVKGPGYDPIADEFNTCVYVYYQFVTCCAVRVQTFAAGIQHQYSKKLINPLGSQI